MHVRDTSREERLRTWLSVFIFFNFKPIERNPCSVIDEEEKNTAGKLLEKI